MLLRFGLTTPQVTRLTCKLFVTLRNKKEDQCNWLDALLVISSDISQSFEAALYRRIGIIDHSLLLTVQLMLPIVDVKQKHNRIQQ